MLVRDRYIVLGAGSRIVNHDVTSLRCNPSSPISPWHSIVHRAKRSGNRACPAYDDFRSSRVFDVGFIITLNVKRSVSTVRGKSGAVRKNRGVGEVSVW
jgi:hypothetical protein